MHYVYVYTKALECASPLKYSTCKTSRVFNLFSTSRLEYLTRITDWLINEGKS